MSSSLNSSDQIYQITAVPIPPETAPPSSESPEEPGEEIEEAPKGEAMNKPKDAYYSLRP
jgi:hypothetical protein